MQDSPDRVSEPPATNGHARPDADSLNELRHLLIGPEIDAVANLKSQISTLKSQLDDPESFARNVRKHPRQISDAISPVLGPAIRKSIADALSRMTQALTQALDNSLSIQGLKWRWEALRTGKSFGEVVLLHTLVFRVEQVFLIHRETGLLLQHLVAPSAQSQDADMISGMLTAIQDFVRDSFGAKEGESLDNVRMGELTVWIEQGPHAILAVVIRGSAPGELRETMKDVLARIHLNHPEALANFQGDAAVLEPARHDLEECLQSAQSRARKGGGAISWPVAIVALVILIVLSAWISWVAIHHHRWSNFLDALSAEPGIVITQQGTRDGHYTITGLRDPLSTDPSAIASSAGIDPATVDFHWQAYAALHDPFILRRARDMLSPPPTVQLSFADHILRAAGTSPRGWIGEAGRLAPFVPGVTRLDISALRPDDGPPDMTAVDTLRSRLESRLIHFPPSSPTLDARELAVLDNVANDILELRNAAADLGAAISIRIHGREVLVRSDATANAVSRQRATNVRDALLSRGVPQPLLATTSEVVAPESPQADLTSSRSVSFKITIATETKSSATESRK